MKIEEGKFYRTRGGVKAEITYVSPNNQKWPVEGRIYGRSGVYAWSCNGSFLPQAISDFDLVAEWTDEPEAPSPIRTKTVTEIVEGDYGRVRIVGWPYTRKVGVRFLDGVGSRVEMAALNATELRAAANLFNQLADALEGGAS